jgi:hypothetical protein
MRILLVIAYGAAGFCLAVVTIAGFGPFGQPLAGVVLPLMLATDAVLRLRRGQAFAAAAGAGLAYEAAGQLPEGAAFAALVLATLLVSLLVGVVFAHYSLPAAAASHLAAAGAFALLLLLARTLSAAFSGVPAAGGSLVGASLGALAHAGVGTVFTSLARAARSSLGKRFFVPGYDL